jgi:hypothetical protein
LNPIKKDTPVGAESEEFESWHKRLFKKGQDAIRALDRKRLSRDLLAREKLSALYRSVRHGEMTKDFLAGKFWNEVLLPELSSEKDIKPWAPGDARTLEAVAIDHLFASGKAAFAKAFVDRLHEMVRAGDEASKAIEVDRRKREDARI